MRCRRARLWVSEYADGVLDARKASRFERHLAACSECREILEDFRTIAGTAGNLETPTVPGRAWERIRTKLKAGKPPVYTTVPFRRGLAPAIAGAAAIFIIAGGLLLVSKWKPGQAVSGQARGERFSLAKLDEAERHYELAVESLGEAVAGQKGNLDPRLVEMFDNNLRAVDVTIRTCRLAVQTAPDDVRARNFLLAAYREKVALLDDYLKRGRKA